MSTTAAHGVLAVVVPNLTSSGAKTVMVELAKAIARAGQPVDLVVARAETNATIDAVRGLRLVDLRVSKRPVLVHSFVPLIRYFIRAQVTGLIPVFDFLEPVPITASRIVPHLGRRRPRVVFTMHNSTRFLDDMPPPKRRLVESFFRITIRMADELVAVSRGVASDWSAYFKIPWERIHVIYNPIDVERVQRLATAPLGEVGTQMSVASDEPTIVAVGRLTPQKDFGMLLRAFAIVRQRQKARLLILGEGEERPRLVQLTQSLGVAEWVTMPGFVPNPYPYMARASVLALSSRYEGFANVLVEALALGVRAVATDCPYGPSEILDGGRYGRLVPVEDPKAMAQALLEALRSPVNKEVLQARARAFSSDVAARAYIELLAC